MAKKELDEELVYVDAFLRELENAVKGVCEVQIRYEGSEEDLDAWREVPEKKTEKYRASARAGVRKLIGLEPALPEESGALEVSVVEKNIVVLKRGSREWRIAVCADRAHPVIKRIPWSDVYDFGEALFGVPCSEAYWDEVCAVYDFGHFGMDSMERRLIRAIVKEIKRIQAEEHSFDLCGESPLIQVIYNSKKPEETIVRAVDFSGKVGFAYAEKDTSFKEPDDDFSFPRLVMKIQTSKGVIGGMAEKGGKRIALWSDL